MKNAKEWLVAFGLGLVAASGFAGTAQDYRGALPAKIVSPFYGFTEASLSATNTGTWRYTGAQRSVLYTIVLSVGSATLLFEGSNPLAPYLVPADDTEGTTLGTKVITADTTWTFTLSGQVYTKIRVSDVSGTWTVGSVVSTYTDHASITGMLPVQDSALQQKIDYLSVQIDTANTRLAALASGRAGVSATVGEAGFESATVLTVAAINGATLSIPAGTWAYELRVNFTESSTEGVQCSSVSMATAATKSEFFVDKAGIRSPDGLYLPTGMLLYLAPSGNYAVKVYCKFWKVR